MRCAIYCRISEDRTGQEYGISRQLQDARELVRSRGWAEAREFSDNDISAHKGARRPGYEDLMAAVDAGQLDRIVVWHTSRLWRNRKERADGIDRLKAARVALTPVRGTELDLTSASGRMLAGILGEFDTADSEIKAELISRAARQRAEDGRNHGSRRAFGYSKDGMELVPAEAAALREAARQLLSGVPLGSVTKWLNVNGIRTVRGGQWEPSTLREAIVRPRHAGLSVWRGEVVGQGQWPPVFTMEVHRALVSLFSDPARKSSTGNRAAYLLSGIATCAVCGGFITSSGIKRTAGGYRYLYRCRPRVGKPGYCVARSRDWVDEYVTEVVLARMARPDARALLVAEDRPDVAALQDEAAVLRVRLDGLAEAFAMGEIGRSQLAAGSERIQGRLDEITRATAHTSRAPVLADLVEASDVRAAWDAMPLGRQREVVRTLITVKLHPGGGGRRTFDASKVEITGWSSQPGYSISAGQGTS
jgi:site-specific DNA recombinase